jgi:hypothetical protein
MTGRVFDPVQKRFLTPDLFVLDPLDSQSFHRFSYVHNNPLRFTDPTGFFPAQADQKKVPTTTQPDGGAAPPSPVPLHRRVLTAAETVVIGKIEPPLPPPPVSFGNKETKKLDLLKRMAWGGLKQLFFSAPPVALGRRLWHNAEVAAAAALQARAGDWDLAANTLLELPQENAEAAARVLTGAIDAALAIPAAVRVATDPEADPEKRGAAAVQGVQATAAVVTAAVGAVQAARAVGGGTRSGALTPGPHAGESIPARGPGREFTPAETVDMNRIGRDSGCHTCGTTDPGTRSGNFVPDHQPPSALAEPGAPQRLYPHCVGCSRRQGGQVNAERIRRARGE